MITEEDLNYLQKQKLNVAANILHKTASLFDGEQSLLPLWGGGVITHGIPKIKKCVIGITKDAEKAINDGNKKDTTNDHLYRVTETAKFIILKIKTDDLNVTQIKKLLLERSALMTTTRSENNKKLKDALKQCKNKDSWEELYEKAKIKYRLYEL